MTLYLIASFQKFDALNFFRNIIVAPLINPAPRPIMPALPFCFNLMNNSSDSDFISKRKIYYDRLEELLKI